METRRQTRAREAAVNRYLLVGQNSLDTDSRRVADSVDTDNDVSLTSVLSHLRHTTLYHTAVYS